MSSSAHAQIGCLVLPVVVDFSGVLIFSLFCTIVVRNSRRTKFEDGERVVSYRKSAGKGNLFILENALHSRNLKLTLSK